jgi:hypothetical protein
MAVNLFTSCQKQKCQSCMVQYWDYQTTDTTIIENCSGYNLEGTMKQETYPVRTWTYFNCTEFK